MELSSCSSQQRINNHLNYRYAFDTAAAELAAELAKRAGKKADKKSWQDELAAKLETKLAEPAAELVDQRAFPKASVEENYLAGLRMQEQIVSSFVFVVPRLADAKVRPRLIEVSRNSEILIYSFQEVLEVRNVIVEVVPVRTPRR